MKINLVSLSMFTGGTLLLYSGVKGYDPRDVIRWAFGGKKPEKMVKKSTPDWEDLLRPPKENPDPGQRYPGDLGIPNPNEVPAAYL